MKKKKSVLTKHLPGIQKASSFKEAMEQIKKTMAELHMQNGVK